MRCSGCLLVLSLVCGNWLMAKAQPPREPQEGKLVLPLQVDATAPPYRALRYRLLPELREMQSGNQIQGFYKCFFEQNHLFHDKESIEKQEKWLVAPLADLKTDKELIGYGGVAVAQASFAARLDLVDWQITNQAKADGVMLLLPDIQQMRMLAKILKIRARGEIARGEFENAIETIQTLLALARTFNEHPTLIGHLVGIAITALTLGVIEEFIQQPGAPNLFWALIDLPSPFIDLRKGREGEKLFIPAEYDALRVARPIPEAELQALIGKLGHFLNDVSGKQAAAPLAYYSKLAADKEALAAAKERLIKVGHTVDELTKLPALQIVLMDDFAQYQVRLDDFLKWTNVPFWKVPAEFGTAEGRPGMFGEVLPSYKLVMLAKVRLEQHMGMLITAEGVRAHAAANGAKLPSALDMVSLPLPVDPVTGQLFAYEVTDGTAFIRGATPKGREEDPHFHRVYKLTIRK